MSVLEGEDTNEIHNKAGKRYQEQTLMPHFWGLNQPLQSAEKHSILSLFFIILVYTIMISHSNYLTTV